MSHQAPLNVRGSGLAADLEQRLSALASALIDQKRARVVIPTYAASSGYWFGGGNLVCQADGTMLLVGRYRNQGDSRSGLAAGERGLELALFESHDRANSFQKKLSFSKEQLSTLGRKVLSIEGSSICLSGKRCELFVSTEKDGIGYPARWADYLKPGTGIWTIDRLVADTVTQLPLVQPETVLESDDPQFLHLKDPVVHHRGVDEFWILFCTHPFCWSSSNTAFVRRTGDGGSLGVPDYRFFPRGFTWDVAISRATALLRVPQVGRFQQTDVSMLFYDGGESLHKFDQHQQAVTRPRGYSCEELGGVAYFADDQINQIQRLSKYEPMFVSPHGTGCSRYVDVLSTDEGLYATWQQAQADGSQPLVLNFVSREEVKELLS